MNDTNKGKTPGDFDSETVVPEISVDDDLNPTTDVIVDEVEKKVEEVKFDTGDIRNYGKIGLKTSDASKSLNKERLKKSINALREKRMRGSMLPEVSDRVKAAVLIDKLFDNENVELCNVKTSKSKKQKISGLAIVGSDVKSLFPSLRGVETARLARKAILKSNISFCNWDTKKAMRYLFINGGTELIKDAGLSRFCPTYLGDRSDLLTVGGDKAKEDSMWRDSNREVFETDMKRIAATVVEVAIHIVMGTHVYSFCGHHFLQRDGGPIGLRSTAALAALIMKL